MANLVLYLVVVLVWGSSWIMIKFQIGVVPAEASIIYRFAIASVLMFAWALFHRLPLRFSLRDHVFIAAQGALIFCINYFLFYHAAAYLTTGLIAVVMSTASIMTMLFTSVLSHRAPAMRALAGAVCGALGIGIIFWPELAGFVSGETSAVGLFLCIGATASFSAGGMIAARNHSTGLSVRGSTAWAMAYGVALMAAFALIQGTDFTFDPRPRYVASLAYLAVMGSMVAFACYFALLARVGAERSSYATVLFPVVALTFSTMFEGYQWAPSAVFGVALTLAGNVLVLFRPPVPDQPVPAHQTGA